MESKCKSKGTPDLMGPKSEAGYPVVAQKDKKGVDASMLKVSTEYGSGVTEAASKAGGTVDGTFSKISMDFSYSKTPKRS